MKKKKVLIIDLEGEITYDCYDKLKAVLDNVKPEAIILKLRSGGGGSAASGEIYDMLRHYRKQGKIIAYVAEEASSGALLIAMASNKIILNPSAEIGSIGVIFQIYKKEDYEDKDLVETQQTGRHKDMFHGLRKWTETEKKMVSKILKEFHDVFCQIIINEREKISLEKLKKVADGRPLSPRQALEIGLVDQIGYFTDAEKEIFKLAKLSADKVKVFTAKISNKDEEEE